MTSATTKNFSLAIRFWKKPKRFWKNQLEDAEGLRPLPSPENGSMGNIEAIKNKIRKLMALGTSSNVYEAANAINKAERLMKQYHLTNSDVAFTQEILDVEKNQIIPEWENQLLSACCFPHNCYVVLTESGEAIITGRHQNAEVSKLMFAYLKDTILRLAEGKTGTGAEQLKTALTFFLSVRIYEQSKMVAWMENPNEYTAAEKYAASLMGKELAIIPEKKGTGEVSRDVLETAGDMAKTISFNRQTGADGQPLQIQGRKMI
jgi:hypothetical protein